MRSRIRPADWSSHVRAIGECRDFDVQDVTMLLLAVKDCWPLSPAVIAACKAAIEKLIEDRAVELAARYSRKDLLGRLSIISDRDDAALVPHLALHARTNIQTEQ